MRKRMTTAVLAAATCVALAVGAAGPAGAEEQTPGQPPTLADVLLSDGNQFDLNPFDYDIVTEAVLLYPDLVAAASNPDAELTAFLPNDLAFRKLVGELTGAWPLRERAVFDAVAALGTDTVATVLQYHILAGPPISYETAKRADGAVLTTLQDGTFEVDVQGRWWKQVPLVDNDADAPDPRVVQPEIGGQAANGFAHGIDRVLRPIDL
jgi:Fasciclin domain